MIDRIDIPVITISPAVCNRPTRFVGFPTRFVHRRNLQELWAGGVALAKPTQDYLVLYDESGKPADRYTWKQATEIVAGVANYLQTEMGVKKGDRIGIAMRNWPE
jgi:long-subunit acyl-CoA synthetase (AMP-forming)